MKRLRFKECVADQIQEGMKHYLVINKSGTILGLITKEHWNRWTWQQLEAVIMSRGCLKEVVEYMEKLGGKD